MELFSTEATGMGPLTGSETATGVVAVVSRRTAEFKRKLRRSTREIRREARRAYCDYFCQDPFHPFLRGRMVQDLCIHRFVYRVRIGNAHRALAMVENRDGVTWFIWYWIGSHAEYDRRLP